MSQCRLRQRLFLCLCIVRLSATRGLRGTKHSPANRFKPGHCSCRRFFLTAGEKSFRFSSFLGPSGGPSCEEILRVFFLTGEEKVGFPAGTNRVAKDRVGRAATVTRGRHAGTARTCPFYPRPAPLSGSLRPLFIIQHAALGPALGGEGVKARGSDALALDIVRYLSCSFALQRLECARQRGWCNGASVLRNRKGMNGRRKADWPLDTIHK